MFARFKKKVPNSVTDITHEQKPIGISDEQKAIDMTTIQQIYGDPLMEVKEVRFTTYNKLGINFPIFRKNLDNNTRDHYFVFIEYAKSAHIDTLQTLGIVNNSILKSIKYDDEAVIYLNESTYDKCFTNISDFLTRLRALPPSEASDTSNKSITLYLINPNNTFLTKLDNDTKARAIEARAKAESLAQKEFEDSRRERTDKAHKSLGKVLDQSPHTGISQGLVAERFNGGGLINRGKSIKRRKSINRRKSIKRRKPRKKRRATNKNKKKLN